MLARKSRLGNVATPLIALVALSVVVLGMRILLGSPVLRDMPHTGTASVLMAPVVSTTTTPTEHLALPNDVTKNNHPDHVVDWQLDTPTMTTNNTSPLTILREHQFPANPNEAHEWCGKHFSTGLTSAQYGQDRILHKIFEPLKTYGLIGRYLDTASSWPMHHSNTFVFDMCLHWRGVCVEGDPAKFHLYVKAQMRTCEFEPRCISAKAETLKFASNGQRGDAYIVPNDKVKSSVGEIIEVQCESLAIILKRHPRFTHFDVWSLDIEGYEAKALESIDWTTTKIDFILVENNRKGYHGVTDILTKQGYVKVMPVFDIDDLWLHKDAIWYRYCEFPTSTNIHAIRCRDIPQEQLQRRSQWRKK